MKVNKSQLCNSCLQIYPIMSDDEPSDLSIADMLDSVGYNNGFGHVMLNQMILFHLQENGGCPSCISLFSE